MSSKKPNPNLLVVAGERVHRYVNGKHTGDVAQITGDNAADLRSNLEYVRQNGLPAEEATEPREPGEVAFERMAEDLAK